MVKSGLSHETIVTAEPRVSPYRLSAHLLSAFALYSAVFWTALDLKRGRFAAEVPKIGALRFLTLFTTLMVATTVGSGAFVAGMDAGKIYNEYPMMGEGFVPNEYWELEPHYRNFFENPATAQFNHRHLALASLALITATWMVARKTPNLPKQSTKAITAMLHMGGLQFTLGLLTLLLHVPIPIAATHQAGSLLLLTTALNALHALPVPPAKIAATTVAAAVAATAASSKVL
eukprot:TRINITY_DN3654_c0_g1_i2.p2 TRINITY_DN3654_c0_g1~~TRINITY_DN3654_c0_g1_i2.p2  ORF type:complete len:232 (-),score=60.36 TRINITY_DN3654_c0_g1_i2:162-857(-)